VSGQDMELEGAAEEGSTSPGLAGDTRSAGKVCHF